MGFGALRTTALAALSIASIAAFSGLSRGATVTATFTASGTDSQNNADLSAQVDFKYDNVAHTLKVILTNTSAELITSNRDFLTGVSWDANALGGTFTSVSLFNGSKVEDSKTGASDTLASAGYYGYNPGGNPYALTASGRLTYVKPTRDLAGDVSNTASPSGPDGGIIGRGGVDTSDSKSVIVGKDSSTNGALCFVISNVDTSFLISSINQVVFYYGTGSDEPSIPVGTGTPPPSTPLPAAAWAGSSLIVGLGAVRAYRRKRQA